MSNTILVVEDEAFVRRVICEILCSAGYNVLSANNAEEAQELFFGSSIEVALLLTDIVLPGATGLELAAKLKKICPSLKILFATGYPEQMVVETTEWGACLLKPFSSTTLLKKIECLLESPPTEFRARCVLMPACDSAPLEECVQECQTGAIFG